MVPKLLPPEILWGAQVAVAEIVMIKLYILTGAIFLRSYVKSFDRVYRNNIIMWGTSKARKHYDLINTIITGWRLMRLTSDASYIWRYCGSKREAWIFAEEKTWRAAGTCALILMSGDPKHHTICKCNNQKARFSKIPLCKYFNSRIYSRYKWNTYESDDRGFLERYQAARRWLVV